MIQRVAGHLECRHQGVDRLPECPEGLGAVGGGQERDPGLRRHRLAGRSVRSGSIGRDEVARDHPGQLLVAEGLEMACGGQVPGPAVALRQGPVGDLADERLDEGVLPAGRCARVGLDGQDLLADERVEAGLERPAVSPEIAARDSMVKV